MFAPALLKDQVAVVTGGGTGIGLAIAKRLGELGARIVDRQPQLGEPRSGIAPSCGTPGSIRWPCRSTCATPSRSTRWSSATVKHFGRIDILVNNAAGNFICRAEDLSPNGWNAVVGIVLNGSFYCSRAVGRHMIARGAAARSSRSSPTTSGPAAPAPSTPPRPRRA